MGATPLSSKVAVFSERTKRRKENLNQEQTESHDLHNYTACSYYKLYHAEECYLILDVEMTSGSLMLRNAALSST